MKIAEYMKTNYKKLGATLADFVQTVSLDWMQLNDIGLPDDILTTVKIMDAAGNELSDLLPFDKEHPAEKVDLYAWQSMLDKKIADIQTGDNMTCDYIITLD